MPSALQCRNASPPDCPTFKTCISCGHFARCLPYPRPPRPPPPPPPPRPPAAAPPLRPWCLAPPPAAPPAPWRCPAAAARPPGSSAAAPGPRGTPPRGGCAAGPAPTTTPGGKRDERACKTRIASVQGVRVQRNGDTCKVKANGLARCKRGGAVHIVYRYCEGMGCQAGRGATLSQPARTAPGGTPPTGRGAGIPPAPAGAGGEGGV